MLIKTHKDIQDLIKNKSQGASVHFEEVKGSPGENVSGMRRYIIELPNKVHSGKSVDIYSLPCDSELMEKHVTKTVERLGKL